MPGKRNAQFLVTRVRDLIQQVASATDPYDGQSPYRDGFTADAFLQDGTANPSTSILSFLNEAQNDLLETGYAKCPFELTLVPGQAQYTMDQNLHEITHVTIYGTALWHNTLLGLDRDRPGWQAYPGTPGAPNPVTLGQPQTYYTLGDQIGFDPAPDQAYVVTIMSDDTPSDLVLPTDIPLRLPSRFHTLLSVRAAWYLSCMDIENDAAAKRIQPLDTSYTAGYGNLQRVIQSRSWDSDDQIQMDDPRRFFRRGGDG